MKQLSRRQFGQGAAALVAVTWGGCAPWEYADLEHGLNRLTDAPPPSALEWRVLNRLAYGPRPGDLSRLRDQGLDAWIEEQLAPESIPESPDLSAALDRLTTLNLPVDEARDCETDWEPDGAVAPLVHAVFKLGKRREPPPGVVRQELVQATVLRAAYGARSLQEVLVEFWSDHFNIDQQKGDCRWLKTVDDRLIRQHALGRFRDLLGASAHSPAMLFYLDNFKNRKAESASGARLNENYARELLELHTLGDTSAYTLTDIQEVARVLTGWTIDDAWNGSGGDFAFRAADHDEGEKVVLGEHFSAGQGERDGEHLLDLLARHPLTARTITGKLCYRFLGVIPTELRDRLCQVFLDRDGDLRAVLAELFRSDDFRRGTQPLFRPPFQFAIAALRVLGVRTSGAGIGPYLESMRQRPFAWPLPDGYPRLPETWTAGLVGRWNFALDLVRNQIGETWINIESLEKTLRGQPPLKVWAELSRSVLGAPLEDPELQALAALNGTAVDVLSQRLALLLMSPQFQWC